jgi:hypothetical protein
MKNSEIINQYPFQWLDELIMVKLNPERNNLQKLSKADIRSAENKLSFEIWQAMNWIKVRSFDRSEKKLKTLVIYFQETTETLITQAKRNMADCTIAEAASLSEQIIISLEEMQRDFEQRYKKYLPEPKLSEAGSDREETYFKVLCRLSVDQLGILIKAADDIKLIFSRSLSLIFRSLVPFLSTEKMKNISWMSMRKSTYQFERSDLDAVIQVLERMIKKIKGYY